MKVIKRDGTEVDFQGEKIRNAILKAFIDKGYTINSTIDDFVTKVESDLFDSWLIDCALAFDLCKPMDEDPNR